MPLYPTAHYILRRQNIVNLNGDESADVQFYNCIGVKSADVQFYDCSLLQ